MINWRIVIIFSVSAIILSILFGGIGGIPILEILLRTVIFTILFALIGIGVNIIIDKYLPELLTIGGETSVDMEEGGEFEAVIPEENPHKRKPQENNKLSNKNETEDSKKANKADSEAQEVDELEAVPDEAKEDKSLDSIEEVENIPDISDEIENIKSSDDYEIDAIPEIESLSGSFSFEEETQPENTTLSQNTVYSKPKTDMDISNLVEDPLKTAKAIQTMIQRDKEG